MANPPTARAQIFYTTTKNKSMKLPVTATVTGLFSVPAERVFDAFLDKKMIGRFMFGPGIRDEEIISLENEPWVGGSFSYVVRRQQKTFDHTGEYIEIDRPHRLVFTWGQITNRASL
jgi:uncharacterized protein YndB with AHSA1/START domain